jgi:opacity protein-like surface antigen
MRSRAAVAALALLALSAPLAAQTPDQPTLIFSISAGYMTGGRLWSLDRQLAIAVAFPGANQWDTVALARDLAHGFAATLSATYFRTPHLGLSAEVGFFGIGTTSRCSPVGAFTLTAARENAQTCAALNGDNLRANAVGILGGLTYRLTKGGVQPYVRVGVGPAILGGSFIEESADVLDANGDGVLVYFLSDQNHKELTWMASLGVGLMMPLAPGYQLRAEYRNLITALPYPTGPALDTGVVAVGEGLPQPPVGWRTVRIPTFTVGLDVVLERKRGHRY